MATWELNSFALVQAIDAMQERTGTLDVELARELGVAPSTVHRIKSGSVPSADVLLSLIVWLRMDATQFARHNDR